MINDFETEQELFWQGDFGDEYINRHQGPAILSSKINMISRVLARTKEVGSVLELGSNVGLNLRAVSTLLPEIKLTGVEINQKAHSELAKVKGVDARLGSILDRFDGPKHDLTMILGVLIHISPDHLAKVYDNLYHSSNRYVLVVEYYNPSPVVLPYRGHTEKLFKRDFAGELMDRFPDLTLVDYAFHYHRDPVFPQDDITWFLMEKSQVDLPKK